MGWVVSVLNEVGVSGPQMERVNMRSRFTQVCLKLLALVTSQAFSQLKTEKTPRVVKAEMEER